MIVFFIKLLSFIANKRIVDEFNYLRNKYFKIRIKYISSSIIMIINVIFYRKGSILKTEKVNFR